MMMGKDARRSALLVLAGGCFGAWARAGVMLLFTLGEAQGAASTFRSSSIFVTAPLMKWETVTVNLLGSVLLGVLTACLAEPRKLPATSRIEPSLRVRPNSAETEGSGDGSSLEDAQDRLEVTASENADEPSWRIRRLRLSRADMKILFGTGFCGAFTTYSSMIAALDKGARSLIENLILLVLGVLIGWIFMWLFRSHKRIEDGWVTKHRPRRSRFEKRFG